MAEYYYLVGSNSAAQQIVNDIDAAGGTHPRSFAKRLAVLKVALGAPAEDVVGDYANAFDIRRDQALESLIREVQLYTDRDAQ